MTNPATDAELAQAYEQGYADGCKAAQHTTGETMHKVEVTFEGWCCTDCLMAMANGDFSGMDDETEKRVVAGLERLAKEYGHVAPTGNSETGEGIREFSRTPCDCCGSTLAGAREAFVTLTTR